MTVLFVSCRNLLDGRERAYPNDNYESGDGKSSVWNGHGYYVPHNRSWKKHHEVIKQYRIFSHNGKLQVVTYNYMCITIILQSNGQVKEFYGLFS